VSRASARERTQRVNVALALLKEKISPSEAVCSLRVKFNLSTRQAYRYLREAQSTIKPLPLPQVKVVFTVKLTPSLTRRVRQLAQKRRQLISDLVSEALEDRLTKSEAHG
jgi:hypothetical protein